MQTLPYNRKIVRIKSLRFIWEKCLNICIPYLPKRSANKDFFQQLKLIPAYDLTRAYTVIQNLQSTREIDSIPESIILWCPMSFKIIQ